MSAPKVFISYSHDTLEHKKWVLDLATRLRNSGIDAVIDQWELEPGDDIPHFMETHLSSADRVLMICTDRYVEKANAGSGGVGYEKMIVTSELLSGIDSNKVIPLIRQPASNKVPTFLKSKLYIDFSNNDEFEFSFDELVRTIHGKPLYKKPEIGNNPFTSATDNPPHKNNDIALDILKLLIELYDSGENSTSILILSKTMNISRILTEVQIETLREKGYIETDTYDEYVWLSSKGKQYAVKNNLI